MHQQVCGRLGERCLAVALSPVSWTEPEDEARMLLGAAAMLSTAPAACEVFMRVYSCILMRP